MSDPRKRKASIRTRYLTIFISWFVVTYMLMTIAIAPAWVNVIAGFVLGYAAALTVTLLEE